MAAAQPEPAPRFRQPLPGELFLYGGLSNACAGVVTNPADVLKVRLQMHGGARASALATLRSIVAAEGPAALMAGWQASIMREMSYSAIRLGLYEEAKALLAGEGEGKGSFPFWKKLLAGGIGGCIGAAIANPTDLLKVRAQALNAATGKPFYSYPNPWTAIADIYRHEGGLRGLYRGVVPTTQRAAILTATQLGTYDEVKHLLLGHGLLAEGLAAHVCASTVAGLAVATTTNPVDLVKSRFMNQPFDAAGRGQLYTGVADCIRQVVRAEGPLALWKGWLPNWLRIGPHTVVTFTVFEALRKLVGLEPV